MRSWGVCLLQAFHVYLYFLTQWSISGWHTFGKVPRDGGCPLVVLSVIFVCESASVHPQQNCINIVSDHQMEHTDFIYHVCMHGDRLVGLSSQWQLMCFVKNKLFSTQGSNLALGDWHIFRKISQSWRVSVCSSFCNLFCHRVHLCIQTEILSNPFWINIILCMSGGRWHTDRFSCVSSQNTSHSSRQLRWFLEFVFDIIKENICSEKDTHLASCLT